MLLVPRSFKYSSGESKEVVDEKSWSVYRRGSERKGSVKSRAPVRTTTESAAMAQPTRPVAVPLRQPHSQRKGEADSLPLEHRRAMSRRSKTSPAHDPNSLPPSIAALLAVTQIPRPKPHQIRRRTVIPRQVSIDELVNEWKSDQSLCPSYGSSPALSMLLEEQDDASLHSTSLPEGWAGDYIHSRSTSAESMPSLDDDDQSVLSLASPPTPGRSLRSRRSILNMKEKSRSLPAAEDCCLDHPLVVTPSDDDPDDSIMLSPGARPQSTSKPKGRFTSNLTLSLQALKNAAITTITSLSLSNSSASQPTPSSPLSDDVLWSHPFLFPRFSPEVRPPTMKGTPTKAQRRYLNPLPLTFEDQEAPFQQALHAPFLAEQVEDAPTIQMQTYNRGRRKNAASSKKQATGKGGVDPNSEAGRAAAGAVGVRMREPRENGDFLRVVVLEMNMRRVGKLENGRAKMWLPPRQVMVAEEQPAGVPSRWVGVTA